MASFGSPAFALSKKIARDPIDRDETVHRERYESPPELAGSKQPPAQQSSFGAVRVHDIRFEVRDGLSNRIAGSQIVPRMDRSTQAWQQSNRQLPCPALAK